NEPSEGTRRIVLGSARIASSTITQRSANVIGLPRRLISLNKASSSRTITAVPLSCCPHSHKQTNFKQILNQKPVGQSPTKHLTKYGVPMPMHGTNGRF